MRGMVFFFVSCDCIGQTMKLFVEITYLSAKGYVADKRPAILEKHLRILKFGVKVLQVLNFKAECQIVKYTKTHSQFKVAMKTILDLREALDLTELEGNNAYYLPDT